MISMLGAHTGSISILFLDTNTALYTFNYMSLTMFNITCPIMLCML